jgi:hypothetical protein
MSKVLELGFLLESAGLPLLSFNSPAQNTVPVIPPKEAKEAGEG